MSLVPKCQHSIFPTSIFYNNFLTIQRVFSEYLNLALCFLIEMFIFRNIYQPNALKQAISYVYCIQSLILIVTNL